nr:hypothetical protein [Blastomonas sp. RAC04]
MLTTLQQVMLVGVAIAGTGFDIRPRVGGGHASSTVQRLRMCHYPARK